MATYKSPVYATKVNNYYRIVTNESICLGEITFETLSDGFLKAIRLFNKNANKHITSPTFVFRGYVYECTEFGQHSETGRGITRYWTLSKRSKKATVDMAVGTMIEKKLKFIDDYIMFIPKSKVNERNAHKYIEQ